MTVQDIFGAVTVFVLVGGALIQITKVIVQHTTDQEFDKIKDQMLREFTKGNERMARLERRQAILETKLSGDSNTFSGLD